MLSSGNTEDAQTQPPSRPQPPGRPRPRLPAPVSREPAVPVAQPRGTHADQVIVPEKNAVVRGTPDMEVEALDYCMMY